MKAKLNLTRISLFPIINEDGNMSSLVPIKVSGEEVIEIFRKGNKIHIKKANRGKFTDYCGGKVTSECISRGKNSSDPKIRKRATFAANARKWKH